MPKLRLFRGLISSFEEAFGFSSEPLLCFYLEGRHFLEQPCLMFTPDLRNVCLLNGVTFWVDDDLGCQMCIEDRPGLIAALQAATTQNCENARLQAITKWRRYCAHNEVISLV
jgi:hypothetical protein